jgi:hypothetical protein
MMRHMQLENRSLLAGSHDQSSSWQDFIETAFEVSMGTALGALKAYQMHNTVGQIYKATENFQKAQKPAEPKVIYEGQSLDQEALEDLSNELAIMQASGMASEEAILKNLSSEVFSGMDELNIQSLGYAANFCSSGVDAACSLIAKGVAVADYKELAKVHEALEKVKEKVGDSDFFKKFQGFYSKSEQLVKYLSQNQNVNFETTLNNSIAQQFAQAPKISQAVQSVVVAINNGPSKSEAVAHMLEDIREHGEDLAEDGIEEIQENFSEKNNETSSWTSTAALMGVGGLGMHVFGNNAIAFEQAKMASVGQIALTGYAFKEGFEEGREYAREILKEGAWSLAEQGFNYAYSNPAQSIVKTYSFASNLIGQSVVGQVIADVAATVAITAGTAALTVLPGGSALASSASTLVQPILKSGIKIGLQLGFSSTVEEIGLQAAKRIDGIWNAEDKITEAQSVLHDTKVSIQDTIVANYETAQSAVTYTSGFLSSGLNWMKSSIAETIKPIRSSLVFA